MRSILWVLLLQVFFSHTVDTTIPYYQEIIDIIDKAAEQFKKSVVKGVAIHKEILTVSLRSSTIE